MPTSGSRPGEPLARLNPEWDPFAPESIKHLVARYGSPLFIIDAERVRRQYRRLAAALPGVDLHYALKPLPHASVINTLQAEGACFDLATNGEVELVRRLKIAPERCIHTHPIKRDSDIRTALSFGVDRFVIDNPDELRKFVKYRNRCSLLIRVSFRSPEARSDLSRKFGAEPQAVPDLLRLAAELRIKIGGLVVSHRLAGVRTGNVRGGHCPMPRTAANCRRDGARAATCSISAAVFPWTTCSAACPSKNSARRFVLPSSELPPGLRVIAEPGRFIAAPAAVAVAAVMGRALRGERWWYYLDDGLYGSYSGQVYDHAAYPLEALVAAGKTYPSVLAGPTCDSIDVINEHLELPKLEVGDLIVGREMGAYTWASASEFNFFPRATVLALDRGRLAHR